MVCVTSFLDLPHLTLPFVVTIIHRSEKAVKNGGRPEIIHDVI